MSEKVRYHIKVALSALYDDLTICVSHALRDCLIGEYHYARKKTITIHNGVPILPVSYLRAEGVALRAKLGISATEFLLVCVARLSAQKRLDMLLMAIAECVRRGSKCKCIIVGDGSLKRDLMDQSFRLGLTSNVLFEGFQTDVNSYLAAGSAFVLTSDLEGFPIAILEAMSHGLPCIVTNVGGNTEAVEDGITGIVVPSGSVNALADAIIYLVNHSEENLIMSRAAREKVRSEFDLEAQMALIMDAIVEGPS